MLGKKIKSALGGGEPLQVGDVVEDFSVRDTDGNELQLSTLLKTGPVVVAFFPKAFTPG